MASKEKSGLLSIAEVPFVDLAPMHGPLREELAAAVMGVIDRGDFILGGAVAEFEKAIARLCDVSHAVGVDSGTSALELALRALGVGPGDEVITAANSFIASALAISHVGATPVLVDIDPDTYNMDPARVATAITARTKAIMPVHLYGHPVDMDAITLLAREHGLFVVEDASQAHGARYRGRRVGSLGDVAAFSLYPAKNLGAFGDAGAVVTDSTEIADKVRSLRNYGSSVKYHHSVRGFNRRLDTLQAAVLLAKIDHIDDWNAQRREVARAYRDRLWRLHPDLIVPAEAEYAEAVYHLFVVRTTHRDQLMAHLARERVGALIHYPIPIHLQPAYRDLELGMGSFPVTEASAGEILSLPMYPGLTEAGVDRVCTVIEEFFDDAGREVPA